MTNTRTRPGEDLERNDGSAARPYYMSPTLREVLWKSEDPTESSAQQRNDEDVQLKARHTQEDDTA